MSTSANIVQSIHNKQHKLHNVHTRNEELVVDGIQGISNADAHSVGGKEGHGGQHSRANGETLADGGGGVAESIQGVGVDTHLRREVVW